MDPRMDILENKRLSVHLEKPGLFYKGSRFDRTGHIMDIVLDGNAHICQSEAHPSSREKLISGIYSEFDILASPDETKHPLVNIGVGLLENPSGEAYHKTLQYTFKPFPIEVSATHDRIHYWTQGDTDFGYAFTLEKTVMLHDCSLIIDYRLTNRGTIQIQTTETQIHYLDFDQSAGGPLYDLFMPIPPDHAATVTQGRLSGHHLILDQPIDEEFHIFGAKTSNPVFNAKWSITDQRTGVMISETLDATLHTFSVWGKSHVISPRMQVFLCLSPGQTRQWKRRYEIVPGNSQ